MNDRLKVAIIDDEPHGVESVRMFLNENYPSFEIMGDANSVKSAVELLSNANVDLVFMDIQLPDGSGFDILEQLTKRNFNIIFVTAYNQYASKAPKATSLEITAIMPLPKLVIENTTLHISKIV